jgi:hypothetical protein
MPRALDTVREVALLENYALPLERADALLKGARHHDASALGPCPRARDAWSADHRVGERDVPRLLPISVAGITRQESRQALAR